MKLAIAIAGAVLAATTAIDANPAKANDPRLCATIADDQARLKCFDAAFPAPPDAAAPLARELVPPIPVRRVKTERIVAEPAPAPGSAAERLLGP